MNIEARCSELRPAHIDVCVWHKKTLQLVCLISYVTQFERDIIWSDKSTQIL